MRSDSRAFQTLVCAGALAAAACGGSSTPTTPTNPVQTNVVTISSTGVSPKTIQIAIGSRVTFINNDSKPHNMTSDPHPDHSDCPDINQVGFLVAGQSKETGNLTIARTCGYHDHDLPATTSLQGSIIIK
jgi:plastocyanin